MRTKLTTSPMMMPMITLTAGILRYMQEIGDTFNSTEKTRESAARAYKQQVKKDPLVSFRESRSFSKEEISASFTEST